MQGRPPLVPVDATESAARTGGIPVQRTPWRSPYRLGVSRGSRAPNASTTVAGLQRTRRGSRLSPSFELGRAVRAFPQKESYELTASRPLSVRDVL